MTRVWITAKKKLKKCSYSQVLSVFKLKIKTHIFYTLIKYDFFLYNSHIPPVKHTCKKNKKKKLLLAKIFRF